MGEQRLDGLKEIEKSARWLKFYGLYPIFAVFLIFGILIGFGVIFLNSINPSTTEDEIENFFNLGILLALVLIMLIGYGELFILFKYYGLLQSSLKLGVLFEEKLFTSVKTLKIGIILGLVNTTIPLLVAFILFSSGVQILDVESFGDVDYLSNDLLPGLIYLDISNLIYSGALLYSFHLIFEWTNVIKGNYPSPMTNDAVTGLNYVRISLGITALTNFLNLFNAIIPFIGFVGFILLILGTNKAGNAIKYFSDLQFGSQTKYQMSYQPKQQEVTSKDLDKQSKLNDTGNMKICPICSNQVENSNIFCTKCGHEFKPEMISLTCSTCGTQLDQESKFCPNCGSATS